MLGRFVPRLRPRRRDDAVQHVPPLHGGRASAALHRRARRDRGAAAIGRVRARQRPDAQDPAGAPRRCSMSRCSCTTSPRAGSRTIRSPARASRARFCPRLGLSPAETDTVAWLVEQPPRDVDDRAVARPVRPQDHREFRRRRAVAGADEAAADPHHRRHPRGRARRVERLEGAAAAHALLRDRAGARPAASREVDRARARRHGAGRVPRRADADWPAEELDAYIGAALSGLLAQGRPAAQGRACALRCEPPRRRQGARHHLRLRRHARRHRADRARARPSAAAVDASPAPAPPPAPTSSTRRSSPPPTASRSTPSRCRASSSRTRTRRAAPAASPTRSRRRCAASSRLPEVVAQARRAQGPAQGLRGRARGDASTTSGPTATR